MSSYKVIQDIEAEDKLIGPLTLRQSIYGGVTLVCLYICFIALSKGHPFILGVFLPIGAITGFFAFPWKGEQPTEIWALARLRFMIKPRVRVWDQSGVKDVVTVLAPRKLETRRPLTNNLSENEVRSRLKALADTIDSRGWATRNASYSMYAAQFQSRVMAPGQAVPSGMPAADDMFDAHGVVAQNFDAMLAKSSQDQRQRVMQRMAQTQQTQQMPQQAMPMQQQLAQPLNVAPAAPAAPVDFGQYPMGQQPAPGNAPAAPPIAYQAPQLPAPVMPSLPAPTPMPAQPNGAPAGNFWFANGPAYPGTPPRPAVAPNQAPQVLQTTAMPAVAPATTPPAIPDSYASAIASGKISADVPIAAAATPSDDELAFAEAAKHQNEALKKGYNHVTLDPASGVSMRPAPSVPGMIDYGRPQPTEDQMQYDTSMPQTPETPQTPQTPQTPASSTPQPVTRKPDPAILELAKNDDLDVATIARQANREFKKSGEVEIQLH
jgi:hypothetical protein